MWGRLDVVRSLLERGANMQIRDVYGRIPRQDALLAGFQKVAQFLSKNDVGGV